MLVSTPIGNLGDLSPRAVEALGAADVVACEDTRRTGLLLQRSGVSARKLVSLHGHNEASRTPEILERLAAGAVVAVVSDAGTPTLSDPGARLVAAAAAVGITVTAVPGPSAAVTALSVSGFHAPRWRFEGFLPRRGGERARLLAEIAAASHPSVLYEAPHRIVSTLGDLAGVCGDARRVLVARELTKLHEELFRGDLGSALDWARTHEPRGEFVIVLEAAPPAAAVELGGVEEALERELAAGLRRSEAVARVAAELGVSRRAVYAVALGLGR